MLKKLGYALLLTAVLLLFWILGKTMMFSPIHFYSKDFQQNEYIIIDSLKALDNLSAVLRFPTISHKSAMLDHEAFGGMLGYIDSAYPNLSQKAEVRKVNEYSRMYTLFGRNPAAKPIILLAHSDVVPIEGSDWEYPPFSGHRTESHIYGRGTLDDKGSMIGILEAVESLLARNWIPDRSLILCIGHDEEIGGNEGAKAMAEILESEGILAHMVLDEGGTITSGLVPGFDQPVGLIGTGEKGYLNLELMVKIEGGHSSMPERETAIDVLSAALARLSNAGFPSEFTPPIEGFMDHLGPHLPFFEKMAFANRYIFSGVIKKIYEKNAPSRALIQTTVVPTIFRAGIKDNIIPPHAKAIINLRLLPGWDAERCVAYVNKVIDDPRVKIAQNDAFDYSKASAPSPTNDEVFHLLSTVVSEHFGDVLPVPYLVLGATDARHFENISKNIYRFMPFRIHAVDVPRIHGINERLEISSFFEGIYFYQQIMLQFCGNEFQ